MSWTAGGLLLDIVGVIMIWASSYHSDIPESGVLEINSVFFRFAEPRWGALRAKKMGKWGARVGWFLLLTGFALQLVDELTKSG